MEASKLLELTHGDTHLAAHFWVNGLTKSHYRRVYEHVNANSNEDMVQYVMKLLDHYQKTHPKPDALALPLQPYDMPAEARGE